MYAKSFWTKLQPSMGVHLIWLLARSVSACALVSLACDTQGEPRTAVQTTTAHEAASPDNSTPSQPLPVRGRSVGGEPVPRRVVWPQASSLEPDVRDRLSSAVLEQLPLSPAPVLVPGGDRWAELGALHIGPSWTAFEAHDGDLHLNVTASTVARRYPAVRGTKLPDSVRGYPALVTQNERIWSASWIEHGVAYAIELECGATARACDDDRELRRLAESLVFVGRGKTPDPSGADGDAQELHQ